MIYKSINDKQIILIKISQFIIMTLKHFNVLLKENIACIYKNVQSYEANNYLFSTIPYIKFLPTKDT